MKIALCGKMRSGKDTVAEILSDEYDFTEFKLSSGIKSIIRELHLGDMYTKKNRGLYQSIGQYMRRFDEDVWCKRTLKDIETFNHYAVGSFQKNHIENTVISDVRQQNEVDFFREKGFVIVKVVSDDKLRLQRIKDAGDIMMQKDFYHETEKSVDGIEADYTIFNNGTLEDLNDSVNVLAKEIKKRSE